jgi:hypothetical protein
VSQQQKKKQNLPTARMIALSRQEYTLLAAGRITLGCGEGTRSTTERASLGHQECTILTAGRIPPGCQEFTLLMAKRNPPSRRECMLSTAKSVFSQEAVELYTLSGWERFLSAGEGLLAPAKSQLPWGVESIHSQEPRGNLIPCYCFSQVQLPKKRGKKLGGQDVLAPVEGRSLQHPKILGVVTPFFGSRMNKTLSFNPFIATVPPMRYNTIQAHLSVLHWMADT